jgi:hypothetical protein
MYLEWMPAGDVEEGDQLVCLLSDASAYLRITGWHDKTIDLTAHGLGVTVHRVFEVAGAPWWVDEHDRTSDLAGQTLIARIGPSPEDRPTYEGRRSYRGDGE